MKIEPPLEENWENSIEPALPICASPVSREMSPEVVEEADPV
jgi:hypothetical protein